MDTVINKKSPHFFELHRGNFILGMRIGIVIQKSFYDLLKFYKEEINWKKEKTQIIDDLLAYVRANSKEAGIILSELEMLEIRNWLLDPHSRIEDMFKLWIKRPVEMLI